jgi:hypothetical protein
MSNRLIRRPKVPEPPRELVSFVKRQLRNAETYTGVERRSEGRHWMVVPVLVQPVDEQFRAIGAPFAVVTRDISPKGIGLVHSEPIEHQWLALQMSLAGEQVNVAAEVLWCKGFGPFYYVGGEFVAKLEGFPQPSGP